MEGELYTEAADQDVQSSVARPAITYSSRQRTIIQMIDQGMSRPEVAEALGISELTVKYHIQKARKKYLDGQASSDHRPLFQQLQDQVIVQMKEELSVAEIARTLQINERAVNYRLRAERIKNSDPKAPPILTKHQWIVFRKTNNGMSPERVARALRRDKATILFHLWGARKKRPGLVAKISKEFDAATIDIFSPAKDEQLRRILNVEQRSVITTRDIDQETKTKKLINDIGELPVGQKNIMHMRYVEHMTVTNIADKLNLSFDGVRLALSSAHRVLHETPTAVAEAVRLRAEMMKSQGEGPSLPGPVLTSSGNKPASAFPA